MHPLLKCLLTLGFIGLPTLTVNAATFSVNDTADAVDINVGNGVCATASGTCTLRAALQEANTGAVTDTIVLAAGTHTLTIAAAGSNPVSSGDLNVTAPVAITGAGADTTIITGQNNDRIFNFTKTSGGSTLSHLSITSGVSTTTGGGIFAKASLTLDTVSVNNNSATFTGGGIFFDGSAVSGSSLIVKNCTLSENSATTGAGIGLKSATAKLSRSTVSGNSASENGGGLHTDNTSSAFELYNVSVTANIADSDANGSGDGGGISNASGISKLKNSILANNFDHSASGNIYPNCSGTLTLLGYDLSDDVAGCSLSSDSVTTGVSLTLPQLGTLDDNGGETKSHALSYVATTSNPAIDAGDPAGCTDESGNIITTDQIGRAIADGNDDGTTTCDIGAYEYADITLNWITLNETPQNDMGTNAVAYNGLLYAFGRSLGNGSASNLSQIYDPTTDSWANLTTAMPTNRESAVVTLFDEQTYVIGGNDPETCDGNYRCGQIANVDVYNPTSQAWSVAASLNHARDVAIVGTWQDKIFVWGGMTYEMLDDGNGNLITNVTNQTIGEYFDRNDGLWHDLTTSMPYAVRSSAYAQVDSKLYVFGGCSLVMLGGNNTCTQQIVQVYDMASDSWTLIGETAMPTGRHFSGQHATAVGDKIVVFGGATDSAPGTPSTKYAIVEIYDTSDNSWTRATDMSVARKSTLSGVINNVLYVAGGSDTDMHVESVDLSSLE